jgi:hypothetical protein
MSADLTEAAQNLADALAEENAALAALDVKRAGSLVAVKERAVAAFSAALVGAENKTLLERAIAAQGRVIAVFAQAAVRPCGYGAPSGRASLCRPVPFALAALA